MQPLHFVATSNAPAPASTHRLDSLACRRATGQAVTLFKSRAPVGWLCCRDGLKPHFAGRISNASDCGHLSSGGIAIDKCQKKLCYSQHNMAEISLELPKKIRYTFSLQNEDILNPFALIGWHECARDN